ncbi:MAG TPA: hypothetical protein VGJ05_00390 [Fimbriiglobus sp.]|jgi:hypothetical protein
MKFGANRSQMYDAQKTARAKWDFVQDVWTDSTKTGFEETTWAPLDAHVSEYLRAVDQLAVIFSHVRTECEFQP